MEIVLKYFSDFTPRQVEQFIALENLYKGWNSKINVISRKDMDSLYEKHVLHSLSIAAVFEFAPGTEIIDIGTGGGFPGIPLAIYFPEVKFHLVDSIRKKIKVVNAIAEESGLANVTTSQTRAEEIKGRKFDFAVSRAAAPLKELWKWSRPLLKKRQMATGNTQADPSEPSPFAPAPRSLSEGGTGHSSAPAVALAKEGPTTNPPGLICLKGGELGKEIRESGLRPRIMEISHIFPEEYFRGKFILYAPV